MIILTSADHTSKLNFISIVTQLLKKERIDSAVLVTLGGSTTVQHATASSELFKRQIDISLPILKPNLSKFNQKEKDILGTKILEYLMYEELIDEEVPCTMFLYGSELDFLVRLVRTKLKARLSYFPDYFDWEKRLNAEKCAMLEAFDNISRSIDIDQCYEMTNSVEGNTFESADFIVVNNQKDGSFLTEAYRISPSKIFAFPFQKNLIKAEVHSSPGSLKDELGTNESITLLFFAGSSRIEEISTFLKVFSKLSHQNINIKVALYGTLDFAKLINDTEPEFRGKIIFLGELSTFWLSKWIQCSKAVISLPLIRIKHVSLLNLLDIHKKTLITTSYTIDPSCVPDCSVINIPLIAENNTCHLCEETLLAELSKATSHDRKTTTTSI